MARLSEALARAAQPIDDPAAERDDPAAGAWTFPDQLQEEVAPAPAPQPVTPKVDAPALALVDRFHELDRVKLVVGRNADPSLVEQYRHLAAQLHHAQARTGCRSVMITSALAAEGKTLTATNLALTLSESYQRRVLLIDGDLRQPGIQQMFRIPGGVGLSEALTHAREGGDLPIQQVSPTLWVLPAGAPVSDPMSLLVSGPMQQLLSEAREAFDWVVLDTSPIAILPDANLLAAMVDTALLVVRAQSTGYPMVQRAAEAIGASRILGVVLNRAEKAGLSADYGYYGFDESNNRAAPRRWWQRRRSQTHVQ